MTNSAFLIDHPSLANVVDEPVSAASAAADDSPDTVPMLYAESATQPMPPLPALPQMGLAPGGWAQFIDAIRDPDERGRDPLSLLMRSHRDALCELSRLQGELQRTRVARDERASELAEAIDLADLYVWSLQLDQRCLRVSPSLAVLLGWAEPGSGSGPGAGAESQAPTMSDLIDRLAGPDRDEFRSAVMQVLRRGGSVKLLIQLHDHDERLRRLRCRLTRTFDADGKADGLRAMMTELAVASQGQGGGEPALQREGLPAPWRPQAAGVLTKPVVPAQAPIEVNAELAQAMTQPADSLSSGEISARIHRDDLVRDIGESLRNEHFYPVFQSVVDGMTGKSVGAEALIRWAHPTRGLVLPSEFLPLCEEAGLDGQLSRLMLARACRHLAGWRAMGFEAAFVSVNLSSRQLARPELIWDVIDAMAKSGIPASSLMLEISEPMLTVDPVASAEVLHYLKQSGLRIAVDNFGAGQGSLTLLETLPIDCIKIDRRLTRDLVQSEGAAAAISPIIVYAGSQGIQIIGEGVESQAQREALLAAGCRYQQGFLFSHPTDVPAFDWA